MEQKKTTKVSTTTRTHHTHSSSNMCNAVGDVFRLGILGGIVIAVSYLIFVWMVCHAPLHVVLVAVAVAASTSGGDVSM